MTARRRLPLFGTALLLAAAPWVLPAQDGATSWRTVELSRQLRDTLAQRVRVRYGAGRIEVGRSAAPLLYLMRLRYDEARGRPLHAYDADQRSVVLGLESTGRAATSVSGREGDDVGALELELPDRVPIDLALEGDGTHAVLDLGGLSLRSLRVECGATEASLRFREPNKVRMGDLEIDVGAADFTAVALANANVERVRLRGGVGVVDLDFGGTWTHDMTVTTRLAVGKLTLRVPADVGVRLELQRVLAGFDHQGFVKRGDAWYSPNYARALYKLQLRAETFFGQVEIRRDGL